MPKPTGISKILHTIVVDGQQERNALAVNAFQILEDRNGA